MCRFVPPPTTPPHPLYGQLGGGEGGCLSFDFPSWRFQFSFLCQTRYANIGRAPTATAMQTFGAVTVTITITVIRCCSVAIAATVTVTGRKCNSTSLHASPHSVQSVPSPGQSSLFHSIPFHSMCRCFLFSPTHRVGVACLSHV